MTLLVFAASGVIPLPPTIITQPSNVSVPDFSPSATFTVVADGTAITYQWQRRQNGGSTFTNIPSATATSYTRNNIVRSQDNGS